MDRKRIKEIRAKALNEEQHAWRIVTGEFPDYIGDNAANTVRQLCGYIGELLNAVKERDDQITALIGDMMQANADLISLREELERMENEIDAIPVAAIRHIVASVNIETFQPRMDRPVDLATRRAVAQIEEWLRSRNAPVTNGKEYVR